jgi:hypothetical protein
LDNVRGALDLKISGMLRDITNLSSPTRNSQRKVTPSKTIRKLSLPERSPKSGTPLRRKNLQQVSPTFDEKWNAVCATFVKPIDNFEHELEAMEYVHHPIPYQKVNVTSKTPALHIHRKLQKSVQRAQDWKLVKEIEIDRLRTENKIVRDQLKVMVGKCEILQAEKEYAGMQSLLAQQKLQSTLPEYNGSAMTLLDIIQSEEQDQQEVLAFLSQRFDCQRPATLYSWLCEQAELIAPSNNTSLSVDAANSPFIMLAGPSVGTSPMPKSDKEKRQEHRQALQYCRMASKVYKMLEKHQTIPAEDEGFVQAFFEWVEMHVFKAARLKDLKSVQLALRFGFPPNGYNRHGNTLLMTAVQQNNIKMVKYLLNNGADVACVNKSTGKDALAYAEQFGYITCSALLLSKQDAQFDFDSFSEDTHIM